MECRSFSYRSLIVWQKSMELARQIYLLTKTFPKDEAYGLTSQIRRSSVSVPSNIAEGKARSNKEFIRFLQISLGSLYELQTQLELAKDFGYISNSMENIFDLSLEVEKMINSLIKKKRGEYHA